MVGRIVRLSLVFCLIFSSSVTFADEPAIKTLVGLLDKMDGAVGKFQQDITDEDNNLLQRSSGTFKVKRPGFFYWQVEPPYEQLIVGTSDTLKVYDPDLEQMTVYAQDVFAGTPAALISGDIAQISEVYDVSQEEAESKIAFNLHAKNAEDINFSVLRFDFMLKDKVFRLGSMTFVDKLQQKTHVEFSELVHDANLNANDFAFEPPPDTDIIHDG